MRRRTFLRAAGLVGGVALGAAGGVAWLIGPERRDAATSPSTPRILRAVMPALLAGALPADPAARTAALAAGLERSIGAIRAFPLGTRHEIGELFMLLDSAPGRWLAGVGDWDAARADEVAAFLQRWRTHRIELFRAGYQALHDLVLAPWYAEPSTWAGIGYPGPVA